ncbi:hypothetical protein C4573_00435 [Candidatus Woesearchaeota archaeon]|nr:MAG: hypothetical protein C4573_00435 [Candidatus Woesearchaeota archaeon]
MAKVKKKTKKPEEKTVAEPEYQAEKKKIPTGFIIILIYFGVSVILALLSFKPTTGIFLGVKYSGITSIILLCINLLIALILMYGVVKKVEWTRDLAMIYFGILLLNALISFVYYFADREGLINIALENIPAEQLQQIPQQTLQTTLSISFFIGNILQLLISGVIFLYYKRQQDYFK